ncbi:MAG: acetyl-CoA carboxylase biotin carboxyl carrier protein subunit, partial [Gammaproteobacteria bacterium]|nr:acetyl-CoA carboxylase biotin carboxyl carrier protein subunit [Gammaproteobacteria bacterium]
EANQELMCIEAMKMEVQTCSTCAGEVTNIFIAKGDSVVADQELITIGQ